MYISPKFGSRTKAMLPLPLNAMVRTATNGFLPIVAAALPRWSGNRERTKDAEQELERILNPQTPSAEPDSRTPSSVSRSWTQQIRPHTPVNQTARGHFE
jgi:hypothetical protein